MLPAELQRLIENKSFSHAYLFFDRDIALEFVKALKPANADLNIVKAAEGKVHILTEDIERLQEEIRFKPFGEIRVVFIDGADNMMAAPQNKLLKTLEEPVGNTVIVLYAERRDALLPTVLSRCIEIASSDRKPETDAEALALAREFFRLWQSKAAFYVLKNLFADIIEDKENGRQRALLFIDAFEDMLHEELIRSLDYEVLGPAIKLTEETRKNIKASYSLGYALKALALNI